MRILIVLIFSNIVLSAEYKVYKTSDKSNLRCYRYLAPKKDLSKINVIHIGKENFLPDDYIKMYKSLFRSFKDHPLRDDFRGEGRGEIELFNLPLVVNYGFKVIDGEVKLTQSRNYKGQFFIPDHHKEVIQYLIEMLVWQATKSKPEYIDYFIKERVFSMVFLRYQVRPDIEYEKLDFHHDTFKIQAILPVSIPKELRGGDSLVKNIAPNDSENRMVRIKTKENHIVIFDGEKTYHALDNYRVIGSEIKFRDIIGLGIADNWKLMRTGGEYE